MTPTVDWVEESGVDPGLLAAWTELVEADPDASLFMTPEWVMTWWRHLGRGRLVIATARESGTLVGLAPMCETDATVVGLPARALRFAGEPEADRLGLLAAGGDAKTLDALVAAVLDRAGGVDFARLDEIVADSPTDKALDRGLQRRGVRGLRRTCGRAPVLTLQPSLPDQEAAYPKSLRTRLRRARKRVEAAGGLEFRRWRPQPEEVPDLLVRLRAVETLKIAARHASGQRGDGVLTPTDRWAFFQESCALFAAKGWLDVATLSSGARLAAYRLGFRFHGAFLDYNLAQDPEFQRLSPGRLLLDEIIRDAQREGLAAVDASRGSLVAPHLLADWTPDARTHVRWLIPGPSWRGRGLRWVEGWLKPSARRVRDLAHARKQAVLAS